MSLIDRLLNIDGRILYLLLFIALAFPILNPVVLPMAVQEYSRTAFEFVDDIPDGSHVLFDGGYTAATYAQGGPGMVANIVHLLRKNCKVVIFGTTVEAIPFNQQAIETALDKLSPDVPAENGVNWVNLGYIGGGGESAVAAFVNDIRSVVETDYFGTPIDQLPIMEDINDAGDFAGVMWWGGSQGSIPWGVRQIVEPFGVPMMGSCTTNEVANYSPYISSGQLEGLFGGVRGSAEYEFLLNLPGPALGQAMATNFGGLLWMIAVILGNIFYAIQRSRGEA
jgi:hypothetical protein